MNASQNKSAVRTRRAIVNLLKQEGPMDSQMLATRLQVSAMAVRQHLYALQEEHLVTYQEEQRSMGRPAKLWQLTSDADRLFPDRYAELSLSLIDNRKLCGHVTAPAAQCVSWKNALCFLAASCNIALGTGRFSKRSNTLSASRSVRTMTRSC